MKTNTQILRRPAWAFGATALFAVAAVAAACGGGSGGYNTASTPQGAATAAATMAPAQPSAAAGVKVGDTALGKVLMDARGFTLYTFTKDVVGSGKSAAEAQAAVWPPLSLDTAPSNVAGTKGAWGVFTRADGKTQVTYNGSPLYTYAGDQAPGETTGDKVGGVWFASTIPPRSVSAPASSVPASASQAPAIAAPATAAPAVAPPATIAAPSVAAASPMPVATAAPEPTKAPPDAKPTAAPYMAPSGGYGY